MTAWERRTFHALTAVVAASGLAYLWMKYGMRSDDPFAVVNHPWQPWMLAVHVFTAPWLLVIFGVLLHSHILAKLANGTRQNRRSGVLALVAFAGMAASGYGLQVVTTPAGRQALVVLHLAASGVFLVAYSVHLVVAWRLAAATKAVAVPQPRAGVPCVQLDSSPGPRP